MLLCRSFHHTNTITDCERILRLPVDKTRRKENEKTRTKR